MGTGARSRRAARALALVAAIGSIPTACMTTRGPTTTPGTTNTKPDFWGLVDALEHQLPPDRSKLESLLNISFERRRDWNKQSYFVCEGVPPGRFGLAIAAISFHAAAGQHQGDLTVELAGADVGSGAVAARWLAGGLDPRDAP
jgi:hypothetical protein